ncbi:MAG: site-specific DNA-methyltransferase [Spirochaetaceae bacterium]|nr:site-specific DNA-methyltransferase [Spirochaetaceae bacterium]
MKAPRNKTIILTDEERAFYTSQVVELSDEGYLHCAGSSSRLEDGQLQDRLIHADLLQVVELLPSACADLLILDPPYNLTKEFAGMKFSSVGDEEYLDYLESWFPPLLRCLKPTASIYLCGDWKNSACLYLLLKKYAQVRNRIVWQREKGRGASHNWKNACEDIWFATLGKDFYFDVESVKQKRRVLAPYRQDGEPKDWQETEAGRFRLTHPGNFWDDISVPYWSMPENTEHPTQKPEKLLAKLVLASCPPGGLVLDPFLGSGTSAVVAKKLGRHFLGVEQNLDYCLLAQKRLTMAEDNPSIQGYTDGVFWERNTAALQKKSTPKNSKKY